MILGKDNIERLPLPVGTSDWATFSRNSYCVDKTLMLKELIDTETRVALFTRPRRFGKTTAMRMIRAFYEGDASLFEDKQIWAAGEKYRAEQGAHPVIVLTFKDVKQLTAEDAFEKLTTIVASEIGRYREAVEKGLADEGKRSSLLHTAARKPSRTELGESLGLLAEAIEQYGGKKPVILIDEYDQPITTASVNGFYDEMCAFMRVFLSGALKDNEHCHMGLMTGVLRVAKEGILSGLNNLKVWTVFDEPFSLYFGFTEDEVETRAKYYGAADKMPEIREWYDGYDFGGTEIYNPWSVLQYFDRNCKPDAYWLDTSSTSSWSRVPIPTRARPATSSGSRRASCFLSANRFKGLNKKMLGRLHRVVTFAFASVFAAGGAWAERVGDKNISPEIKLRRVERFDQTQGTEFGYEKPVREYYLLQHPVEAYDKPGRPLLVVLHSAGHDAEKALKCTRRKGDHDIYRAPDDFFALYPDSRMARDRGDWWWGAGIKGFDLSPCERRVMDMVARTIVKYGIDSNRVYVCGNSMGGSGALAFALRHGDVFAAGKANVPAGVTHALQRTGLLGAKVPAGVVLPDPAFVVDYSAPNDKWSDGHEELVKNMRKAKFGWQFFWGGFGHENNDAKMLAKNDLIHGLDWLSIRKDAPYPAFFDAVTDTPSPWKPGGTCETRDARTPGQINGFLRWADARNLPNGGMEMALFLMDGPSAVFAVPERVRTGVAVRRLARRPRCGDRYAWTFGSQKGVSTVGADGLLSIPSLTVTRIRETLRCVVESARPSHVAMGAPPVVTADATHPLAAPFGAGVQVFPNVFQVLTVWNGRSQDFMRWHTPGETYSVTGFTRWVELMACTGGNDARDLFKDPHDRTTLDDYRFDALVKACRGILRMGAKPYLKLGNVPPKFSSDYDGGEFAMNIRPPDDPRPHYRYMKALARTLRDAFGRDEVRGWRFAVLTEADNAGWFAAKSQDAADTRERFFELYDWTALAFEEELGGGLTFGTHLLYPDIYLKQRFRAHDVIAHCLEGRNRATGCVGAPLKLLTISYYHGIPGEAGRQGAQWAGLFDGLAEVRGAALAAGFSDIVTGVDEGRVITSRPGLKKKDVAMRAVGQSYQAAFDVRCAKSVMDAGANYFAMWGFFSGSAQSTNHGDHCWMAHDVRNDVLAQGGPAFPYFTAREFACFEGMTRIPASAPDGLSDGDELDALAALACDGRTVRVAVSRFRDQLEFAGKREVVLTVKVPVVWDGRRVRVSVLTLDDRNNWFVDWEADRRAAGIADTDYLWSPDCHAPLCGMCLQKAEHRAFFAQMLPKYMAKAGRVRPAEIMLDVLAGTVRVPLSFVGNGAAFATLALENNPTGTATVNFDRNFRALPKGEDFHSIARQRKNPTGTVPLPLSEPLEI